MAATCLRDIDAVVLAGGLGTRIRRVLGGTPRRCRPENNGMSWRGRLYGQSNEPIREKINSVGERWRSKNV